MRIMNENLRDKVRNLPLKEGANKTGIAWGNFANTKNA